MKRYLTEFIGTFFFIFATWMTVPTSIVTGAGMMTRLSIGLSLAIMVYAGAHISGAHYNPAITFAAFIQRRISALEAGKYIAVQILAGIFAAFVVLYLLEPTQLRTEAFPVKNGVKALVAEFLATFALAYVYLNVLSKGIPTEKNNINNSYYGLAIGLTLTVMAYSVGTISGGVFNPITFMSGGIIKWGAWSDFWIYLFGCFGGAGLAAFVYNWINAETA